jgi:hypothetical protein
VDSGAARAVGESIDAAARGVNARPRRSTRVAEFEHLKTECERLRADFEALRDHMVQQAEQLKIQFARTAQMQAVLDEQRLPNGAQCGGDS